MSDEKKYLYFKMGDNEIIRVDEEDRETYESNGYVEACKIEWIKNGLSEESRAAMLETGEITQEEVDEAMGTKENDKSDDDESAPEADDEPDAE